MTTTGAHWASDGYDIHVVTGTTLDQYLLLDQSSGGPVPAHPLPPGVTDVKEVTFTPTFTGTTFGDTVTQSGVRIGTKTGVVEIIGTLGTLRNFIVEAKVTLKNGKTFDPGPVRIHVHNSLREAWLTPAKLTVPLDDPVPAVNPRGYRLSMLALFAEDPAANFTVVGDITRQNGLLFTGSAANKITWSSSTPATVFVNADSGELAGNAAGSTTITAHFPFGLQPAAGGDPTATVFCRGAWPSVEVQPVDKLSTAFAAHNVLILPEGFANTERTEFEQLAGQLVSHLRSAVVEPMNLLPLNYWTAWIDLPTPPGGQPDRGISVLSAIKLDDATAPQGGNGIDAPAKPTHKPGDLPAKLWDRRELIYKVGLPTPADSPFLGGAILMFDDKLAEWQALVGPTAIDKTVVDADSYLLWIDHADYRLAEERDSAFSIARGDRPRAREGRKVRTLAFHPLRMTREHLDRFLSKLTRNFAVVGSRWTDPNRDRAFVVFLCAGAPKGGTHSDATVLSSLSDNGFINLVVPPGGLARTRVELSPKPLPKTPSLDLRTTVAHEFGHALGLGDEYGEDLLIPAARGGGVISYTNLHLASELLVAGKIKADAIRWRWPRIQKAALLADPPTGAANTVTIKLQPGFDARGKDNAFEPGDVVRLRERPLERIVNVGGQNRWQTVQPSTFRLRISAKPSAGMDSANQPAVVITAVPEPPGSPLPASFAPYAKDSLLIMPVPDPDNPGQDLLLMAKFVEDRIAEADVPLNRRKGKACAPTDGQQFPLRLDDSPRIRIKQPWIMQRVVGVYDGGMTFHCGVYHPTGACTMRRRIYFEKDKDHAYPFCHICRYMLADRQDPTLHAVIEKSFRKNFAVKK